MGNLKFDITAENHDFIRKYNQVNKAINDLSNNADLQSGRIDKVFNNISLKGLERIQEIMQSFPKEIQGLESYKKQISDLEKRIEQANKKIIDLQNQAKQPITVHTNVNEVAKEHLAYDSLLKSLNDILRVRGENIALMLREQNAIRINQKELKVLEDIENKGLKLSANQQYRRVQLINSISEHKQAISSFQQVITNEIKLEKSAEGSMNEMSLALGRMRMAYRQLTEQERNSKFGQDLSKNIQEADAKIKQLDSTIGVHARNVGDYSKQWNGLQYQMQMVARELPNFAINPQIGIMSLTNNIPYLVDELSKAKKAYTDYVTAVKAGQTDLKAVPSVGKQVLSSLLNWQTAIVMAITLITAYRKEISDWVGGLFKAKDAVKELLSAEQEMALARRKGIENSVQERAELDLLYKKLKDTTLGTEERNAAVSEWVRKHPQHSNIMKGELVDLGKLDLAYQSLSKQIIEAAKARAYADKITELESKRYDSNFKRQVQFDTFKKAEEEYYKTKEKYDKLQKDYDSGKSVGQALSVARVPYMDAKEEYEKQKKIYDGLEKQTNDYVSKINHISEQIKIDDLFTQPEKGTYDYWQQQVQIADGALKQIKNTYLEVLQSGNKEKIKLIPNDVVKQYNTLTKQKKEAEKALKVYDNPSSRESAAEKAAREAEKLRQQQEKYALLMDKQAMDKKRLSEDLANQQTQSEIDIEKDAFKKLQAQRKLDNEKEIQALERQKEDYSRTALQNAREKFDEEEAIEKAKKPKHVVKTFNPSIVTVDTTQWDSIIANTSKKQQSDQLREQEDSWDEYLIKYGTFQSKKEALDRKYQKSIKEAPDAGKAATLQKEWDEAIANLKLDKLKTEINWEVVFGDMSKITKKQLQEVKKQLAEFKKSPEFKNATPEQIKVIEDAVNNINNALVDKGGFFGGLGESLDEYKQKVEEAKKAQEEYDAALKTGNAALIEKAETNRNQANAKVITSGANVEKSKDKAISNINAVSNAIVQLGKENVSLTDIGNTVGALVDTLSQSGSKIGGIISAILSIIDAAGEVGTFQYGLDIIENVSSSVTDAFARDTEAITGLDMSFMRSADYDDYNELKEEYDSLFDVWDQLLDKKKAYIKESYGIEATKVGEEALKLLQSEKDITKELGNSRLGAGASAGSHSLDYRMWKGSYKYDGQNWKDVAGDISKSQGVKFDGMSDMLNMSSEQLEWIKTNYSGLWAHMDGEFQGHLENIIKFGETEEEIIDSINEQLTQTSFDSVFDSFVNTLMDMDASSKDFADNFEEYMRKAIFTSMFAKNYEDELKEWYKAFALANKKEGGITEDDVKDLRGRWDGIVDGALSDREAWEKIVGSSDSSSSQNSTSKGFAAMSQDTGDELNGRFTALQVSNEEIKNSMLSTLASVNLISSSVVTNGITLMEIRNLALMSNSYLEDIAGYNKKMLVDFGRSLENIDRGVQKFNGN